MKKIIFNSLCCLIVLFFCGAPTFAQLPQYIKLGGTSSNVFPLSSTSSNRVQWIYTSTDFTPNLPNGGLITKVYYHSNSNVGTTTFTNLTVKLGHTTLNNTVAGPWMTPMTTVYTAPATTFTGVTIGSWLEIELQTPFYYNGTDNLIIEISQTGYTGGIAVLQSSAGGNKRMWGGVTSATASAGTGLANMGLDMQLQPTYNNAGVSELTAPFGFCPSTQTVKVMVKNYGNNIINNLQVQWTMNGVAQPTYFLNTPLDSIGGSGLNELEVTLGNYTFGTAPVNLKAWTHLPNGVADTNNLNDTLEAVLQSSLSGTYTINNALPTGGTNYNSFTAFANDLNNFGVCGPVVANVAPTSGPYNETVKFEDIVGASAINTITVNGNGRTVQFSGTSQANMHMLSLNGTKYLKIDSVNFKTLGTTYGWGAAITGGYKDSITRCTFDLTSITGTSSVNSNGITISGSLTSPTLSGSGGSRLYIADNDILGPTGIGGPYYGITSAGDSDSNIIKNNLVQNFYFYGMYISGGSAHVIDGNEVTRRTKTSVTTFYGIYLSSSTAAGITVKNNRIHSPIANSSTSTSSFYGIYNFWDGTSATPAYIYNNAIYNINQGGLVYAFYNSTVLHNRIYHNTIDIGVNLNSSSANYGIYAIGTNTGTEFKNNLITITGGGTGTKYGAYYSTTSSADDLQRNNIYVNSTQAGTQYHSYYGAAYATLAAFQAANPTLEVGSVSIDPQYVNVAAGNLSPDNPLMIATGTNLMSVVPTDINGLPRTPLPTVGAFEKPPFGTNNAGTIALIKPTGNLCPGLQPVSAAIMNGGINTINNVTVNWSVNGVVQTPVVHNTPLYITTSGQPFMDTVSLGTMTLPATGSVELKIWTSNPNGSPDIHNYNDTLTVDVAAAEFDIAANLDTICAGNALIMNLTPNVGYTPGGLSWQWSSNGTTWTTLANTDSTVHTVPNLTTDRYYRVRVQNELTTCYTDSQKIVFTDPQMIYWNDTSRCGPGYVTLAAVGGYGSTVKWYDQAVGGQLLGTGNTHTTSFLTADSTYYVSAGLGAGGSGDSVNVPLSLGNTSGVYHHMFLVNSQTGTTISEIGIKCMNGIGTMTAWDVYYRPDNYQLVPGANTSATGWTLISSTTNVPSMGTGAYTTIATGLSVSIPAGQTYSFYIAPVGGAQHQYASTAMGTTVVNDPQATIIAGNRGSSLFNCTTNGGIAIVNLKFGANCESPRQMVQAIINPLPEVDLGEDMDTCIAEGTTFLLDAGVQPNNPTFLWDNNSTAQTRAIGQTGVYTVAVTNQYGCVGSDTIDVNLRWNPVVDLSAGGVNLCIGGTKVLDAGPGGQNGGSYYWNTGAQTQTITITQGGQYIAYVTNSDMCLTIDTVNIIQNGYMPTIASIMAVAQSQNSFTFSAINPQNVTSYFWDFGDGNTSTAPNPTHPYAAPGDYTVKLTTNSICGSRVDSSTVHVLTTKVDDVAGLGKQVLVYPNPNNGSGLSVEALGDIRINAVVIYNLVGQKVADFAKLDKQKVTIQLPNLSEGMYLIEIQSNKGRLTRKFDVVK